MSTNTNLFVRLQKLLPGSPLLVADVVSGSGSAWVLQLPDGSQIAARGSASVGDRVFVRGGLIEGQAPHLTVVTVEV